MGEMKTFDGVLLSIEVHQAKDALKSKLISKGYKSLADAWDDIMHEALTADLGIKKPGYAINVCFKSVCVMREIDTVLRTPLPKFKPGGTGIAMFSEKGQEISVHSDGKKSIVPTSYVVGNPVKGFRPYSFEDGM